MYTELNIDTIKSELKDIKDLVQFVRMMNMLKDKNELQIKITEPQENTPSLPQNKNPMESMMGMLGGEEPETPSAVLVMDPAKIKDMLNMMIEYCSRLAKDKERIIKSSITGKDDEPSFLQMDLENTIKEIVEGSMNTNSAVPLFKVSAKFKIITPRGALAGNYSTTGLESEIDADTDVFNGDPMNSFWQNMGRLSGESQQMFVQSLKKSDIMQDIAYLFQQKGVRVNPTDIVEVIIEEERR